MGGRDGDERAANREGDGGAVRAGDPAAARREGRRRAGRAAARRGRRRRPGRRRRRDGAHGRPGLHRPGLRVGARRVVRRAHPRVGRRHERPAAPVDGGRPQPAARDHRRGAHLALGRVPPGVRGPRARRRHRPHRSLRRLRVADGRRRGLHGLGPRGSVRHADDGAARRPRDRHEGRGDRGDGAVRGHVPRTPGRGRRRRRRRTRRRAVRADDGGARGGRRPRGSGCATTA